MNNVLYPNFGEKRTESEVVKPEVISAGRPRVEVTPLPFSAESRDVIANSEAAAQGAMAEVAKVRALLNGVTTKVDVAESMTFQNEGRAVNQ